MGAIIVGIIIAVIVINWENASEYVMTGIINIAVIAIFTFLGSLIHPFLGFIAFILACRAIDN